jgi:hypothetical protein
MVYSALPGMAIIVARLHYSRNRPPLLLPRLWLSSRYSINPRALCCGAREKYGAH